MSGCQTCGGFNNRHDPVAHGWAPTWATCPVCEGEKTVRRGEFDETCRYCKGDGGWEQ